jgi:hypothetical protein
VEAVAVVALIVAVAACVGLYRRYDAARHERRERTALRSSAHIWGLVIEPGESNSALRARLDQARRAGTSADPIETAARAMRAQRERSTRHG